MDDAFVTPAGPADLHAWHVLRPLLDGRPYLPFSPGTMRVSALVRLCNTVVHRSSAQIVECGSGVSTVVLARLLAERGAGRLTALEHDAAWAEVVQHQLAAELLDDVARLVHAPLDAGWYADEGVARLPDTIDILIVDGPPADRPELAESRGPALERLGSRLTPDAIVVLDDIGRAGEQAVLARWERETDWQFDRLQDEAMAIGRRAAPGRGCGLSRRGERGRARGSR